MAPLLQEGQIVIAVKTQKPKVGDLVVARHKDMEIVKKVTKTKAGQVYLAGRDKQHDFGWLDKSSVQARIIWPKR